MIFFRPQDSSQGCIKRVDFSLSVLSPLVPRGERMERLMQPWDSRAAAAATGEKSAGLRASFKISRRPAARDFGRGQGGEFRASPQRAVRNEPTPATDKRPAARRVFGQKAAWLRCFSVTDRWRVCSLVAPRHPAFCPKTGPLRILKQALIPFTFSDQSSSKLRPAIVAN